MKYFETILKELVPYIHLNPLRAGLVKDLDILDRYKFFRARFDHGQK